MSSASDLPEVLNEIFDLPVDWDFCGEDRELSLETLKEFSRMAQEIVRLTGDNRYHSAITFLWSARKYVGIDQYNSNDFFGTEISADASRRIQAILEKHPKMALNVLAPVARTGPTFSAILIHKDRDHLIELFLQKERLVLLEWGLNQQSIEIVISRLRKFGVQAFFNLTYAGSMNSDSISRACHALSTLSKVPVAAYARGQRGEKARSTLRGSLERAKDKLIGIATLFGDAYPLVSGASLDVTSFISTASGATAMALLPRSNRE